MIENLYKDVSNPDLLKTCNTIVRLFDRSLNKMDLLVNFKFCDNESTVEVMGFTVNSEMEVCNF